MPDDPTSPPRPPFLGGRVYIPADDWEGRRYWRRDLTAEPKLHRLLSYIWASFDSGFISMDSLHLLDELVGGPPIWSIATAPEEPPEDWQHAASVEGPRGLVQFVHKGEEASRTALAKLLNSATLLAARPPNAEPALDDATEEDLDLGGMVVETDPVEACLDMVSEAIEELVYPGAQVTLITGEQSGVLKIGDAELSCMKANGVRLLRSLLYTAEAIVSTQDGAVDRLAHRHTMAPNPPPSLAAALEDPAWLKVGLPSGESVGAALARVNTSATLMTARSSMAEPVTAETDVPTVILPEMPPIVVRWLVVDEDGECVCYCSGTDEDDARRAAAEQGAGPDDRISPDPYMLDDWEEERPLVADEGALVHARRRHLTWRLLEAVKRDHLRLREDADDAGVWYWEGANGLRNANEIESGELIKLLWDCQTASPDEALLKLGLVLQAMVQAAYTPTPIHYRRPVSDGDGELRIGRATIWVGAEFDGVAECLRQLAQSCVDPGFRLPEEIPASEVPTVELPAPPVTDMADAVGLADDEEGEPAVRNCDGYTLVGKVATQSSTILWRTPHRSEDMLEVTHRIPGDVLREALGISRDDLLKKRHRDVAERTLDNVLLCLEPAKGFEEDVTVSESEDGKVCVSLQGRVLVAADEEGAKILRALGELFKTRTIPW